MTTYGVIADIHGNLQALEATLGFLHGRVDRVVCLGDIVGYTPHANECARLLADLRIDGANNLKPESRHHRRPSA